MPPRRVIEPPTDTTPKACACDRPLPAQAVDATGEHHGDPDPVCVKCGKPCPAAGH